MPAHLGVNRPQRRGGPHENFVGRHRHDGRRAPVGKDGVPHVAAETDQALAHDPRRVLLGSETHVEAVVVSQKPAAHHRERKPAQVARHLERLGVHRGQQTEPALQVGESRVFFNCGMVQHFGAPAVALPGCFPYRYLFFLVGKYRNIVAIDGFSHQPARVAKPKNAASSTPHSFSPTKLPHVFRTPPSSVVIGIQPSTVSASDESR